MISIFLHKLRSSFTTRKNINNWHEDFIVHLAKVLKPNVYVELGLYRCDIFNRIIPHANTLIGVDLSTESGKYMRKSKKTSFQNITTDDYYEIIKKTGIKIDMLFIDANHSQESVKRDFENYFNLVSDNGLILLHDGYPKNEEFTQP
jgi:predicted O-methyltransferase YrrM